MSESTNELVDRTIEGNSTALEALAVVTGREFNSYQKNVSNRPTILHGAIAMAERDFTVLCRSIPDVLARSLVQPLLFVFVFTFVYPKIGTLPIPGSIGISTIILPGVMAFSALFCGLYAIGMPMAIDLGTTRDVDDRAAAPIPTIAIPLVRLASGSLQAIATSLLVVPMMFLVAAEPPAMQGFHPVLAVVTISIAGLTATSIGLLIAGLVKPSRLAGMMTVVHLPLTFLGAGYYPWAALAKVPLLQYLVLLNPMTYVAEGLRAALTPSVPHISPWLSIPIGILASAVMAFVGARRVALQVNQSK